MIGRAKELCMTTTTSNRLHLYVLLDRSGSMQVMRDDVIAGFNELLAEQKASTVNGELEPRITLVQFDDVDLHEVVVDAQRVSKVPMLTIETFAPRGMTPLLDATTALLTRARTRATARKHADRRPEAVVVVTITDGEENASRHTTRAALVQQIRKQEKKGWTFAFLGAGLDAYDEAGALGYDSRSVQAWAPDGTGARHALRAISGAAQVRRTRLARGDTFDSGDFFEGTKTAEDDRDRRLRSTTPEG
jgi:uncharacterized protein YegL